MREPLGVILAGGRGSRMGGLSKADLTLGHETLLSRCEGRLSPQSNGVVVVANAPVQTTMPVISDSLSGYLGPLAGILAGLEYAAEHGHSHIVTAAVDTPFFPCDLTPKLLLAGLTHPNGFAIASTADGMQGTFGLWPVTLSMPLKTFLSDGHRKVRTFIESHNAAVAVFPSSEPDPFFNINTPEQLEAAAKWM